MFPGRKGLTPHIAGSLPAGSPASGPTLSLAALEGVRADTPCLATKGGMGPMTLACLDALLQGLVGQPEALLAAATDADAAGKRYAQRLAAMAKAAGVCSERLAPPDGQNDWNDMLRKKRREGA